VIASRRRLRGGGFGEEASRTRRLRGRGGFEDEEEELRAAG
jgi:hypothetical protein